MNKYSTLAVGVLLCFFAIISCKKLDDVAPSCSDTTPAEKANLEKKWTNTFTQIDTYSSASTDSIKGSTKIYPSGYFQLNSNGTYNVFSDNAILNGTWAINKKCQLVLDSAQALQRNFTVLALSKDSLTIRRRQGNLVYTQHYKTFDCGDTTKLVANWSNTYTRMDYLTGNYVYNTQYQYPYGYFKLNADATYNVLSNGVPLDGTWMISNNNCQLVLDRNTAIERAFSVVQVSSDSLTIQRMDSTNKANPIIYTQHYIKQN